MKAFTWDTAVRRRLARQGLLTPLPKSRLVDAVRMVGGVQAQVLSAAELALGARVAEITRQNVQAALWDHHTLVKTYGPRGTLHLLPADELPLWMAALQAAANLQGISWHTRAGLDASEGEALLAAIGEALDGRILTRKELADEVTSHIGEWARERLLSAWGEMLAPAALAGKLCFGPSSGSQVTFARADQWIGHWEQHDPWEALIELARRYIATYGPSTPADVAHWFRLKPDQARALMDALASDLEAVDFAGRRAWMLAADAQNDAQNDALEANELAEGTLRLLPQYDSYLLGCGPRERIVPETARPRVNTYGRGRYEGATGLPVLLINGAVAGIWGRNKPGRRSALRVETFVELSAQQHEQLDVEVARIGVFLGVNLTLSPGRLDG